MAVRVPELASRIYSTTDLMRAAGVTPQQISYDVRAGNILAERVGRNYAFTQGQYDRALEYYRRLRAEREGEHGTSN